ncbi:MAG: DUF1634 domain-containing protein [Candidatus Methanosuratus sp.]|nr:DUF1634 domain-containing protein [Candidatus Methanosuratincola sp.]
MVMVESLISWVLRIGVFSGATITLIGFFTTPEITWLGVLVLILTPFMRVVMTGIYFLSRRDWAYFSLAIYVIMMLVIGSLLHMF